MCMDDVQSYACTYVAFVCMHAHVTLACILACLQLASIKCFLTLKIIHYFRTTKQDFSRQQKMSNMTTEKKDLKRLTDIDHSLTFNSKVSNIADDNLFNKETVKSGLKRKKEPENIVGTKKSKKRLRRL